MILPNILSLTRNNLTSSLVHLLERAPRRTYRDARTLSDITTEIPLTTTFANPWQGIFLYNSAPLGVYLLVSIGMSIQICMATICDAMQFRVEEVFMVVSNAFGGIQKHCERATTEYHPMQSIKHLRIPAQPRRHMLQYNAIGGSHFH